MSHGDREGRHYYTTAPEAASRVRSVATLAVATLRTTMQQPCCVKDINFEKGGLMRALLDRDGHLYHVIYTQRTACERINSQAQALGIERSKVCNIRSVRNLNTLIYLVINARALAKAKSINRGLLQMN